MKSIDETRIRCRWVDCATALPKTSGIKTCIVCYANTRFLAIMAYVDGEWISLMDMIGAVIEDGGTVLRWQEIIGDDGQEVELFGEPEVLV